MPTLLHHGRAALLLMAAVSCSSETEVARRPHRAPQEVYAQGADVDAGSDSDADVSLERTDLLAASRRAELVGAGFSLTEGPVWDPCGKRLLFTDVNAELILQLRGARDISVYRERSNFANGLAFDRDGALLAAEMGGGRGGRITRTDRAGRVELLIDRTPFGFPLNTTDDLALRSDGTLYFSDPTIPHGAYLGIPLGTERLYRLTGQSPRTLVAEDETFLPNGVDLSPDENTLYAVGYLLGEVLSFHVAQDGALSEPQVFTAGLNAPDSMCLDVAGNLYIGTREGLAVVRPNGTSPGTILLPTAAGVTNCAFGGDEGKTLFVTAWDTVWRIPGMPIVGLDWQRNRSIACE